MFCNVIWKEIIYIAKGQFKPFNKYKINGNETIIYIERRDGSVQETVIDTEELEKVKSIGTPWHSHWARKTKSYYCRCCKYISELKYSKTIQMSRFIVDAQDDEVVDHIDHDTMNNKKENLRVTKFIKNVANRKGANSNNKTGVRNVNLVTRYGGKQLYFVQIMRKGEKFKWEFELNEFEEACAFAELKRQEIFGEYAGNG